MIKLQIERMIDRELQWVQITLDDGEVWCGHGPTAEYVELIKRAHPKRAAYMDYDKMLADQIMEGWGGEILEHVPPDIDDRMII
jgi:hypothetical protein